MNPCDTHPLERIALILQRYVLALSIVWVGTSQVRWVNLESVSTTVGMYSVMSDKAGTYLGFLPPQPGLWNGRVIVSGDYADPRGARFARLEYRLDIGHVPVVSMPG